MFRALSLAALLGLAAAAPAVAAYVLYYHVWDAWTVTCWRAMLGPPTECRLSAPRESVDPGARQNLIAVAEVAPDAFRVTVEVRDLTQPVTPLFLRVDNHEAHQVPVARREGNWTGAEAAKIIDEMLAGQVLVYRVFTAPDGTPRDTEVSLTAFAPALETYRSLLRDNGLLADGRR